MKSLNFIKLELVNFKICLWKDLIPYQIIKAHIILGFLVVYYNNELLITGEPFKVYIWLFDVAFG